MAVKVTAKVEHITPEIAKEMLTHNSRNPRGKKMSRRVINQYVDDIKAGLWELNGEAIVFDEDGFLKNGQHRLMAIVIAGVPIDCLVVRGVSRTVRIFDTQYRRTLSQMINAENDEADSGMQINPNIVAAANLIVNNFGATTGAGVTKSYIRKNLSEFERVYRTVCYGGAGHILSKCAPCIAAGYLMLRTEYMPQYELEVFFRNFNAIDGHELYGYDNSPAKIAREMFKEYGSGRSGYQLQKEKLELVMLALEDFHNTVHREEKYKITEPFHFQKYMDEIRSKDGLVK